MIASCRDLSVSSMNCSAPPRRINVHVFALAQPVNRLNLEIKISLWAFQETEKQIYCSSLHDTNYIVFFHTVDSACTFAAYSPIKASWVNYQNMSRVAAVPLLQLYNNYLCPADIHLRGIAVLARAGFQRAYNKNIKYKNHKWLET